MGSRRLLVGTGVCILVLLGASLGVLALTDDDAPSEANGDDGDDEEPQLDLVVVGDSFAEQSHDQLLALAEEHRLEAEVTAFGGTSICGWEADLQRYADAEPRILVLSFAGNDIQPCMTDDPEQHRPPAVVAQDYRADLDATLELFRPAGTRVYVVSPPPVGLDVFEERAAAMRTMYRDATADHPDLGLIDSATYLDPDGRGFQERLPCAEWDDCPDGGDIRVRQSDSIHLTPAGGERYARAIFDALDL